MSKEIEVGDVPFEVVTHPMMPPGKVLIGPVEQMAAVVRDLDDLGSVTEGIWDNWRFDETVKMAIFNEGPE